MPKKSKVIQSYLHIINYIIEKNKNNFYPKITDLKNYLENFDINISNRTINRYLNQLVNDFNIPIEKKGHKKGYFIDNENFSIDNNPFIMNLQIMAQSEFFNNVIQDSTEYMQYISFSETFFKGFNWIDKILQSIHNQNIITIKHKKFNEDKITQRSVEPYFIKEFEHRWYLVGMDKEKKEIRNFGIDRIIDIHITKEKFDKPDFSKIKERYQDIIGLKIEKPEIVKLRFNKFQKNYYKSKPWHWSSRVIKETDDYLDVELFVGINYELEQKILADNYTVKVLYPPELVKSIKELLQLALKNYQ